MRAECRELAVLLIGRLRQVAEDVTVLRWFGEGWALGARYQESKLAYIRNVMQDPDILFRSRHSEYQTFSDDFDQAVIPRAIELFRGSLEIHPGSCGYCCAISLVANYAGGFSLSHEAELFSAILQACRQLDEEFSNILVALLQSLAKEWDPPNAMFLCPVWSVAVEACLMRPVSPELLRRLSAEEERFMSTIGGAELCSDVRRFMRHCEARDVASE